MYVMYLVKTVLFFFFFDTANRTQQTDSTGRSQLKIANRNQIKQVLGYHPRGVEVNSNSGDYDTEFSAPSINNYQEYLRSSISA